MKKLFFTLLCMICFIGIASAKTCTIVSGDGTNIGDEIDCAGERFYVIDNDGENIKTLAKYNLIGGHYYQKLDTKFTNYDDASVACRNKDNELSIPETRYLVVGENEEYYCIYGIPIPEETVIKQSPEAIGAHGKVRGVAELPDYGVIGNSVDYDLTDAFQNNTSGDSNYIDFKIKKYNSSVPRSYNWYVLLNEYKDYLTTHGVVSPDVSLITIKELDDIAYKVTNKRLPLAEWATYWDNDFSHTGVPETVILGSLIDNLPEKYSWLWSTTYWTRTANTNRHLYFIDTWGDFCSAHYCAVDVGAGLRPVVTLPVSNLEYNVKTKTDGHGKIKVEKVKASGGEKIKFTVEPNEGYVLSKVKVTDALGNVVVFNDYTFTMPNANVLIEATFVKRNPETADINLILITGIALLSFTGILFYFKKMQEN